MRYVSFAAAVSAAFFAVAAQANTKSEDCRGMLNGASVLIGVAQMLNDDYISALDPNNKNQEAADKARRDFRKVNNDFLGLMQKYRLQGCGETGDLEQDLGQKFPELGKQFS